MKIFILTYGRHNRQHTFNNLPKVIQDQTTLVVQAREKHLYKQYANILVLPSKIETISPTRQYVMKWAQKQGIKKLCMLDDDLRFDIRRMDEKGKFYVASEKDVVKLFKEIEKRLDKYAHVGVLAREGGNRVLEPVRECTRMMRVLAYQVDTFFENKINFDRVIHQQDFDVTLQLLRKGFKNLVLCEWVQGQGSSNAPGGCSHYRTIESQSSNASKLAELHPGFVKVVEKETKGAWGGGKRLDVLVQWKKAYESANVKGN